MRFSVSLGTSLFLRRVGKSAEQMKGSAAGAGKPCHCIHASAPARIPALIGRSGSPVRTAALPVETEAYGETRRAMLPERMSGPQRRDRRSAPHLRRSATLPEESKERQ